MRKYRQRRRPGVWHHRVPDFKLVYCGPKPTKSDLRKVKLKEGKIRYTLEASQ